MTGTILQSGDGSGSSASSKSLFARIIREPLLHFLLVGLALFVWNGLVAEEVTEAPQQNLIEISTGDIESLSAQFSGVWQRPPGDAELQKLIENFVREEVYYREAILLGLDVNDAVVRRRLSQKMEFLTEAGVAGSEPGPEELQAYYSENLPRYTPEPRISFEQVFLGQSLSKDASDKILSALEAGQDPSGLGVSSLLPTEINADPRTAVDGTFGEGFFAQLKEYETAQWSGPVQSAFGVHLVRLSALSTAGPGPLEKIRDKVVADWRRDQAEIVRNDLYEALLARYEVVLPELNGDGS